MIVAGPALCGVVLGTTPQVLKVLPIDVNKSSNGMSVPIPDAFKSSHKAIRPSSGR